VLKRIIQVFMVVMGSTLGYRFIPWIVLSFHLQEFPGQAYFGAVLGAILFLFGTKWFVEYVIKWVYWGEETLFRLPLPNILFGTTGIIIGLAIAFLLYVPISRMPIPVIGNLLPLFVSILLGYYGYRIVLRKREEIMQFFSLERGKKLKKIADKKQEEYKILDPSVILDGRIADVCKTGFLDGTIVIPEFVLAELQNIADSSDNLTRNRGRKGLDILKEIQKDSNMTVIISERNYEDIQDMKSKLFGLALELNAKLITNDLYVKKLGESQGIQVVDINDVAHAVQPVLLTGEEMKVNVIKQGKEADQGIAYMDDGTMIIVEKGNEFISSEVNIVVTNVRQTSAGKLIFAKVKT
jgi:uncharacterized protein YacL